MIRQMTTGLAVLLAGLLAGNAASSQTLESVRAAFNVAQRVDAHAMCRVVTATHPSRLDVFIPVRYASEWQSFLTAPPQGTLVTECTCATPWGTQIASGTSITAYSVSSVAYGTSCSPYAQTRTCSNGKLTGSDSYKFQSCSVQAPKSCTTPWGSTVPHGGAVTAYSRASVAYGQSCPAESRTCNNGSLSGSASHSACAVEAPSNCVAPWGATVAHGSSVTAYPATSVPAGSSCSPQTRTCNNGSLSGSATHASCSVQAASNCTAPWGATVAHGSSVTAYAAGSVPAGSSCSAQTRTCNNGSLSGSGNYASCAVQAPSNCTAPWGGSIAHGSSVTAYPASSVPAGSSCSPQTRTCNNGLLSGSGSYASCTPADAGSGGSAARCNVTSRYTYRQSCSYLGWAGDEYWCEDEYTFYDDYNRALGDCTYNVYGSGDTGSYCSKVDSFNPSRGLTRIPEWPKPVAITPNPC